MQMNAHYWIAHNDQSSYKSFLRISMSHLNVSNVLGYLHCGSKETVDLQVITMDGNVQEYERYFSHHWKGLKFANRDETWEIDFKVLKLDRANTEEAPTWSKGR